jgi:uncharacterized oxidoreductase
MKTTGNAILIAGDGSGIDRSLAQAFHAPGNHVIIPGRSQPPLDHCDSIFQRLNGAMGSASH